jgi:molybdopterin-guanine dinucleotide biosynthesis protein B
VGQVKTAILGINGFSKSGKTQLIEQLLPILREQGLRVAVIKHQNEPVRSDTPGSDTDRFYQAGATVLGFDGESVFVKRVWEGGFSLEQALEMLGGGYDLVLVEGFKESEIDKIWLLQQDGGAAPEEVSNVIATLGWDEDRKGQALKVLGEWLERKYQIRLQVDGG